MNVSTMQELRYLFMALSTMQELRYLFMALSTMQELRYLFMALALSLPLGLYCSRHTREGIWL
jgi:hypothetical protein